VAVEGHTDSQGDDAYNQRLSERRAQAVRDYLKDVRQVPADRMTVKGLGESRPVAQNMTPDGKENASGMQKNRRVEVVIAKS
jgi:outer membrane protein OmpA-like peptidoglycan-associated protein